MSDDDHNWISHVEHGVLHEMWEQVAIVVHRILLMRDDMMRVVEARMGEVGIQSIHHGRGVLAPGSAALPLGHVVEAVLQVHLPLAGGRADALQVNVPLARR